jgi:S1-C subfamily serine protease
MPGEFDFLDEEPKPKPKAPRPTPKAPLPIVERLDDGPPRAQGADDDLAFVDDDALEPPPRDRPAAKRPTADRRARSDRDDGPPRKAASPLLFVGIAGGALLVIGGAIALIAVFRPRDPDADKDKNKGGTTLVAAPTLPPPKKELGDPNNPSPEVVAKVKKATVMVRVLFKDGTGGEGSGFVEKSSGLIVTNAHVVGLKDPKHSPWKYINLVVNSGLGDKEFTLAGEIEDGDVDPENDLALIHPKIIEIGERHAVPDGIVVAKNPTLVELQSLFVFGFPLGTSIGAEISVRPTKISSFRQDKNGKLKLIQCEGGITFGNSGGPVIDVKGNVVGVVVARIKDDTINFAVPSEKVLELLQRRNK